MKKSLNIILLILSSIFMFSFIEKNNNVIKIKDSGFEFVFSGNSIVYSEGCIHGYTLADNDSINGYRIVSGTMKKIYLVYVKHSYSEGEIYGYTDFNNEFLFHYLTETEIKKLDIICEKNIVEKTDDGYKWNHLNKIRDNFWEKVNYSKIITYGFDYNTQYQLALMTSTDENLDGYKICNYEKTSMKTDDDIVRIVPKEWFYSLGEHIYTGKEYMIYMKTYKAETRRLEHYYSEVFVFDIDITNPNSTNSIIFTDGLGNRPLPLATTGIFIEPVISGIYIGVENNNQEFQTKCYIDNTQYQVVVQAGNIPYITEGMKSLSPIYLVPQNITMFSEYDNSNIVSGYESFTSKINIENAQSVVTSSEIVDSAIVGLTKDLFANLVSSVLPFGDLVSLGITMVERFSELANNLKKIKEENVIKASESSNKTSYSWQFPKDGLSLDYNNFQSINLIKWTEELINRGSMKYDYAMSYEEYREAKNSKKDMVYERSITLPYYLYAFDGSLLTSDYEKMVFTRNDETFLSDGVALYEQTGNIYKFNIVESTTNCVTLYKAQYTGMHYYKVPANVVFVIRSYDGRIVSTSKSKYVNLPIVIASLKNGEYYFFESYYDSGTIGSVDIQSWSSSLVIDSKTYTVPYGDSAEVFRYETKSAYNIYSITTSSRNDTHILVYDSSGRLIAQDDDSNADWSEDSPDMNANLQVGLAGNQIIYIVIVSNGVYLDTSVTVNVGAM